MTTEQTPEQEARAGVENPRCVTHAPHDHAALCVRPALDLYGRERYLAGKVEEHDALCTFCPARGTGIAGGCPRGKRLRAEYAACVAEIQTGKPK